MIQEFKGANKMNMTINIKGDFESKYMATAVIVTVPIPTTGTVAIFTTFRSAAAFPSAVGGRTPMPC